MGSEYVGGYKTINKLGKGRYGKTRLCQTPDNYFNAIKIYELLPDSNIELVLKQFRAFHNFENKFLFKIKNIFQID